MERITDLHVPFCRYYISIKSLYLFPGRCGGNKVEKARQGLWSQADASAIPSLPIHS